MTDNSRYVSSPESSTGEIKNSLGANVLESYKVRLPRRNRKKAENLCWGLSLPSWLFLLFALLQGR